MKFSMVMIICFATGVCETLFDSTQYDTYDQCIEAENSTALYMQKTFPMSNGEIHCLDEMEIIQLEDEAIS